MVSNNIMHVVFTRSSHLIAPLIVLYPRIYGADGGAIGGAFMLVPLPTQ